jgi:hypothetical protein
MVISWFLPFQGQGRKSTPTLVSIKNRHYNDVRPVFVLRVSLNVAGVEQQLDV